MNNVYNKRVRPCTLFVCDLVLKAAGHVQKRLNTPKCTPKWKGPYVIGKAYDNGYFWISRPNFNDLLAPIKATWLKHWYPDVFKASFLKFSLCLTVLH